jgi:SAM-dependent methyltransferase
MPADHHYDTLASVYDWIVPEALTTPRGSVEAFLPYIDDVPPDGRALDCAAGAGPLAVGLAQRGFDVTATDASAGMVERTRALAAAEGVDLVARECAWAELATQGFELFDVVFCVGNSLAHARGRAARQAALGAMARVTRPGGVLVLTSRNFEQIRAERWGLKVFDHVVVRDGRPGVPIYSWWIAEDWEDMHEFDVAVALIGEDGTVLTPGERLQFWPFSSEMLDEDLRAVGLEPETTTYAADVPNYVVTARRPH